MRSLLIISVSTILFFGAISCAKRTSYAVISAEIGDSRLYQKETRLWLSLEDKFTFGISIKRVTLRYLPGNKLSSPLATLYFDSNKNAYRVDIEMPTSEDVIFWEESFDKNEPTILYPKP